MMLSKSMAIKGWSVLFAILCVLTLELSFQHSDSPESVEEALWLIEESERSSLPNALRLQRLARASSILEPAHKDDPSNQVIALSLAHCYLLLAKKSESLKGAILYERAEAVLRKAVRNDQKDYIALGLLADVLAARGKNDESAVVKRRSSDLRYEFINRERQHRPRVKSTAVDKSTSGIPSELD